MLIIRGLIDQRTTVRWFKRCVQKAGRRGVQELDIFGKSGGSGIFLITGKV